MTTLRNIWQDLIDKRLWPFAVGLLVLIVAIPVVLARSGKDDASTSVPAGAVVAGAESVSGPRAAVIVAADPDETPTGGALRNPFYDDSSATEQQPASSAPSATGTSSSGGGSTGSAVASAGTDTGSTSSGSTGSQDQPSSDQSGSQDSSGGSTDSKKQTSPTGSGESGYDVNVRLTVGETTTKFPNTPRLTPLPSAENPLFVYLGVLSDKKTAVFMVAAASTAVGDGTCRPSADLCETLEIKAGETEFLDVTTGDNQTVQYQLDLVSITKIGTGGGTISKGSTDAGDSDSASAASAGKRAVRRARKDGAADTLDRYRFEKSSGVIRRLTTKQVTRVRARHRARARAASAGTLHLRRTGTVVSGGL